MLNGGVPGRVPAPTSTSTATGYPGLAISSEQRPVPPRPPGSTLSDLQNRGRADHRKIYSRNSGKDVRVGGSYTSTPWETISLRSIIISLKRVHLTPFNLHSSSQQGKGATYARVESLSSGDALRSPQSHTTVTRSGTSPGAARAMSSGRSAPPIPGGDGPVEPPQPAAGVGAVDDVLVDGGSSTPPPRDFRISPRQDRYARSGNLGDYVVVCTAWTDTLPLPNSPAPTGMPGPASTGSSGRRSSRSSARGS